MANQEHLTILKQGVEAWNQWREKNPHIRPDLSKASLWLSNIDGINLYMTELVEANLSGISLRKANLKKAYLYHTQFSIADIEAPGETTVNSDLSGADLSGAYLAHTNFLETILSNANLKGATLSTVEFNRADLSGANLSRANLEYVTFIKANLKESDLSQANMKSNTFIDVDLSAAKGLGTVIHGGPTDISISTISQSRGNIPEIFLRGAGIPDSFIIFARSLAGRPNDYYTCFISYSSKDEDFAKRLYTDLQNEGVRCWFAPEDLKIGAKIRISIDESIRLHDKLLLVLSQHSVASQWVEQEVERALARERKENSVILFPIRLDKAVMDIEEGWPALIRNTRNIGNFTHWKRQDAYQKAFNRLLRDLKAEAEKTGA